MAVKTVEIAVITKAYSGAEGHRVKAGSRFAVGKEQGDMPVISKVRFNELERLGLARAFGDDDKRAVHPRPLAPRTLTTMEGPGSATARNIRQAHRNRTRQEENPALPKQVAGPNGSQTGAKPGASASLPVGQASSSSTSGARGRRGAASSASTTPAR